MTGTVIRGKPGQKERDTQEKYHERWRQRWQCCKPGTPKNARKHQKLGERYGIDSPSTNPNKTVVSDIWHPEL